MIRLSDLMFISIIVLLLFIACNSPNPDTTEQEEIKQAVEQQPAIEGTQPAVTGCQVDPEQRQDIAILPDAKMGSATANFIAYQTGHDVGQTVQFYQDQMVQHGWMANESNVIEADHANLIYTKANDLAMLVIDQEAGQGAKVVININNTLAAPGCGTAGS